MKPTACDRIGRAELADYASGDLSEAEAAAIEEHLFSCSECGGRAAEMDALVRGIQQAVRSSEVGGFVTDAVLNRLSRDGVRVRTFTLSPGAVVPCAVWEDDELMALRLRGDFGGATEFTVSQAVGGTLVSRVTGQVAPGPHGEIIFATPAETIRRLPVVHVEVVVSAHDQGSERTVGRYTLVHGGSLHRR